MADINVKTITLNKLTQEQYSGATINPNEFYLITDAPEPLTEQQASSLYAPISLVNTVNSKQDTLTTEQLNAVNSGITAEHITAYDAYATEISQAQTTANKADTAATVAQQTANLAGQNAAQALEDLKSKANTSDLPQNQTGTAGQVYTKTADGADWSTLDVYSKEETNQQIQNAIGTIETALAEV